MRPSLPRLSFPLLAVILGTASVASAAPPQVTVQRADTQAIRPYTPVELNVTLRSDAAPYTNPFDPDEVRIDAVARGPKGAVLHLPGFWSQAYRTENAPNGAVRLVSTGEAPGWHVRLALPSGGIWHVSIFAHDKSGGGASAPLTLTVTAQPAPGEHGFVRRAPGNTRYFAFDDGRPYFLVGENVCWAHQRGLGDYDTWFSALGKAGGNYARLWMQNAALESKESVLGRYDLQNAAYFDGVLERAQRNGIRCMLALGTYGEFRTGGYFNEGRWPANPYNAANGGPVPADTPDAFFTSETARKLYQRRLRYLIARYSSYTSLGFWEFWNETA